MGASLSDGFDQRVGVVALVGYHRMRGSHRFDQRRHLGDVGLFGSGQRERQRIAQGIDDQLDFSALGEIDPVTANLSSGRSNSFNELE